MMNLNDIEFPENYSLYIRHNHHKQSYEKIEEYLNDHSTDADPIRNELTEEEYKRCLSNDEIWEIQLYPRSPVSFYLVCAPSFLECVKKIHEKVEREE